MRLIDADAIDFAFPLPDNLEGMLKQIGIEMVKIRVSLAPTIEAEPVRHGRWDAKIMKDIGTYTVYWCSECNCYSYFKHNYCPNCGCKMDGDSHD